MITHDIALSAKQRKPFVNRVKSGPLSLSLSPRHSGRHGGRAASRRPRCLVCWSLTVFIWRRSKVGGRPQLTAAPPHPHYSGSSSPLWSRRRAVFRHLLGGGSAAVELAPVTPHRGLQLHRLRAWGDWRWSFVSLTGLGPAAALFPAALFGLPCR